jgi:hypothetical protein
VTSAAVPDFWSTNISESFPVEAFAGEFDVRVFFQTELWVDRFGVISSLAGMSSTELENILLQLFDDAEDYQDLTLEWYSSAAMMFMSDVVTTDMNESSRISLMEQAHACVDVPAQEWLKSTPLVVQILSYLS